MLCQSLQKICICLGNRGIVFNTGSKAVRNHRVCQTTTKCQVKQNLCECSEFGTECLKLGYISIILLPIKMDSELEKVQKRSACGFRLFKMKIEIIPKNLSMNQNYHTKPEITTYQRDL